MWGSECDPSIPSATGWSVLGQETEPEAADETGSLKALPVRSIYHLANKASELVKD